MPELRSWLVFLLVWSLSDADLHDRSSERQVFISFFTSVVSLERNNERVCFGGTLMWAIAWKRSISAWHTPAEKNSGCRAELVFFKLSSASTFLLSFNTSTDMLFSSPAFCAVVFIHHSVSEMQMVVGWMFDQWPKWKEFMAFDWYEVDERHYSLVISLYCVVM